MKRKLSRREQVLLGVAGLLAVCLAIIFLVRRGGGGIVAATYTSRFSEEDAQKISTLLRVPVVDLGMLEESSESFAEERNLFAYGARRMGEGPAWEAALPPAGQSPPASTTAQALPGEAPAVLPGESPAATLPEPPAIPFKFVGFIGPPERKTVFLKDDESGKVFIASRGEVIAGQYRILDVGYEHVDIGYVDPQYSGRSRRIIFEEWAAEAPGGAGSGGGT